MEEVCIAISKKMSMNIKEQLSSWTAPTVDLSKIQTGDMPGDSIQIGEGHIAKANNIFPVLLGKIDALRKDKVVISVHGGSGVGKSEIGSLIAHYLKAIGVGSYVLSGDNYPRRIPQFNDAERYRIYRYEGLKALREQADFSKEMMDVLMDLQANDQDSNPENVKSYPWIEVYQTAGETALRGYLGTPNEQDFDHLNSILDAFKQGAKHLWLKRMGREALDLWYEKVDVSNVDVIVIEWTHGNNKHLNGVDIPILLNSTPEETMEHRKLRNRDKGVDSPFTTMVLKIEQTLLHETANTAEIICLKSGDIVDYAGYLSVMKGM